MICVVAGLLRAGLAFLVIAAGMIASSALAQHLVTRLGVKAVLTAGLLGLAAAQVLFLRLPAAGSYAAHLLPGFAIVAAALGWPWSPTSSPRLPGSSRPTRAWPPG